MRTTSIPMVAAALAGAVALAGCGATGNAETAEFPSEDLSVVIPYNPGGSTDTMGRLFTDLLADELGVGVKVENVPGAVGSTGVAQVVTGQDQSGHTVFFAPYDAVGLVPLQVDGLPYEAADVNVIGIAIQAPSTLAVKADAPWNTLEELVAAAKADPGTIRVAAANSGSQRHMTVEALSADSGAEFAPVFFTGGAGEGVIATLQGSVEAVITDLGAIAGQVEAGELKVLGTSDPNFADNPLLEGATHWNDAGYGLVENVSDGEWVLAVSKDVPEDAVNTLREAFDAVVTSDGWRETVETRYLIAPDPANTEDTLQVRRDSFTEALPLMS